MTPLQVALCLYCNTVTHTAEEALEHIELLLNDTGLLQGLIMAHGKRGGARRYLELGRVIHMTEVELREST